MAGIVRFMGDRVGKRRGSKGVLVVLRILNNIIKDS